MRSLPSLAHLCLVMVALGGLPPGLLAQTEQAGEDSASREDIFFGKPYLAIPLPLGMTDYWSKESGSYGPVLEVTFVPSP